MTLLSKSMSHQDTCDNQAELEVTRTETSQATLAYCWKKKKASTETQSKLKKQWTKSKKGSLDAWRSHMQFFWTSSAPSVTVNGWKAATASFKESKMTNEVSGLSRRQSHSPPWQPHTATRRNGNRAVCHMPKYLLQMRKGSCKLTSLEEWDKVRGCMCIIETGMSLCIANAAFSPDMPMHIWNWEREELGSAVRG